MRRCRRLAWLAVVVTCGLCGWVPAAAAGSSRPTVVVLAVPGLLWSDVASMPALRSLAATSSVGELSVKAAHGLPTDCADGLLTVSAGNRASASTVAGCAIDMSLWPQLARANASSRYAASLGALGSALQAGHVTTVAVSPAARPMLANQLGTVDVVAPTVVAGLTNGGVIAILDQHLYDVPDGQRGIARAQVDAGIAALVPELPDNAVLMVAGVSDGTTGHGQLHALVVHGPGWAHTELRSSAAGRAPFVEDIDIAPTILAALGEAIPASMVGRPMQRSGSSVPSISRYVDDNRHAQEQRTLGQLVFLILGIAAILMMVLAALPLPAGRTSARWLARLIAPVPVVVFAANGLPWWRSGQVAFAGIVVAGALLLAAATTVAARRSVTAALLVVPVVACVVLAADQLTGSTLQLSAPLGDSPLIAGRFAGMGNLDFAVFSASALIVAAVLGARLHRRQAVVVASVIVAIAVIVDGLPQLGNDIGGVLALLPAGIVVVALAARFTVTARRAVAVLGATVVVAVGLALADYSRPPTSQTHVGRFVGQVLHGGAGTEVRRKFDSAVGSFGLTIGTFVVGVALVAAYIARDRIKATLATSAGGYAAAVGVTVVAVLGMALNDSGITIAAMVAIVAVSALYGSGLAAADTAVDPPG